MNFAFLWYFLFPLILLAFIVRYLQKTVSEQKPTQALCVPFFKMVQKEGVLSVPFSYKGLSFVFWCAWLFLILAVMRPVHFGDEFYMPTQARQIMLVLDASGSMAQQDFILNNRKMTRLGAVKLLANDFLEKRRGDAVGLTIFGTEAFIYVPLTQDIKTAQEMLLETGVGIAGDRTAIGDALTLALKEMKDIASDKKVIILLSDGFANAGIFHPDKAIDMAKNMNVKIYTIGLGSETQKVNSFFFVQQINPSADLDEATLKKIAKETGGQYFRVRTSSDLKQVYDTLDKLEPVEIKGFAVRPQVELFWIPLCISVVLFLLGFYLKERYT